MRAAVIALALSTITLTTPSFAQGIDAVEPWQRAGCPPRCNNPTPDQIIDALRPSSPPSPARGIPPHRLAAIPPPQAKDGGLSLAPGIDVPFATGSSELTPEAVATLNALGKALVSRQLTPYRFLIEGHADLVGTQAYNQRLSERRATVVAMFLQDKFKVAASRLIVGGTGSQQPFVPTMDPAVKTSNRRVTITNAGAAPASPGAAAAR